MCLRTAILKFTNIAAKPPVFAGILMTLILGITTVFAATDDAASSSATTQSGSAGSAEKTPRQKDAKSGTRVNVLSVAASVLCKTEADVKEAVKTGKVGDLLTAAGKVDDFKTAYLAQAQTCILYKGV